MMSGIEYFPNWIYTFLIIPIVIGFQKHFSLQNRVTKVETIQESYTKKIDKMCKSSDALSAKVNTMIGRMDEHLRQNQHK